MRQRPEEKEDAPISREEFNKLQEKLQKAENDAKLRAKYGNLNEKQLKFYHQQEREIELDKERRAQDLKLLEERYKLEELERKKAAVELVHSGHLKILVEGKPVLEIGEEMHIFCPSCGKPKQEITEAIIALVNIWRKAEKRPDDLLIYSARNPLGRLQGMPAIYIAGACPSCKEHMNAFLQLVV